MTLRIDTAARGEFAIFVLSGRIEAHHITELTRLFELEANGRRIVLDLKETKLVDRDAIRFLVRCEADGVKLENCPGYVRKWMKKEKG